MAGALSARPRRRMTAHDERHCCPRCDALATSWVYVGGKMFLCADCHAELEREGEPVNIRPGALEELMHAKCAVM